nr:MAG TPA: Big defensin [Caudoviricetes sp.]
MTWTRKWSSVCHREKGKCRKVCLCGRFFNEK